MKTWWWSAALLAVVTALGVSTGAVDVGLGSACADEGRLAFRWGREATRARRLIGPLDQGLLMVEILTQSSAQDGEYETLIQTSWLSSDGSPAKKQVLFEGFGAAYATEFVVQLEGRVLVLQFPTGREGERSEARWSWRKAAFEREPQLSPALVGVVNLLEADRITEARDALEYLMLSSRGGVQFEEARIFYLFLKATHRQARARYEAGARREAAALVVSLFLSPPVTAPMLKPMDGDFVICVGGGGWGSAGCEGGFNEVPSDGPTASLLNDCAFLLQQGGYAHLAAPILRQVVESFPGHALARLNLADTLWSLGEQQESCQHYQSFLDIYRGPGPIPGVPDYVLRRLAEAKGVGSVANATLKDLPDAQEAALNSDL